MIAKSYCIALPTMRAFVQHGSGVRVCALAIALRARSGGGACVALRAGCGVCGACACERVRAQCSADTCVANAAARATVRASTGECDRACGCWCVRSCVQVVARNCACMRWCARAARDVWRVHVLGSGHRTRTRVQCNVKRGCKAWLGAGCVRGWVVGDQAVAGLSGAAFSGCTCYVTPCSVMPCCTMLCLYVTRGGLSPTPPDD